MTESCRAAAERLPELVGTLTEAEHADLQPVREHVAACASCQAELEELTALYAAHRRAARLTPAITEAINPEPETREMERRRNAARERFLAVIRGPSEEAARVWGPVLLPPFVFPPQFHLAAADADEQVVAGPPVLLPPVELPGVVRGEIVATHDEARLFLTVEDPRWRDARMKVVVSSSSGSSLEEYVQLDQGQGVVVLPAPRELEGTCSIELALAD